ncbi:MAG: glycosyltransferase [Solirubrobacteraceae bacterium]
MSAPADVLLLSLGTTRGLQIQDAQFAQIAREAGASVATARVRVGAFDRLRRGYPINDTVEALAARRALAGALARGPARSVVLSTTTAALLARPGELPYAVWLDSPARLNRPGLRNRALHLLERRSLARARLVIVLSPGAVAQLPDGAAPSIVISPPVAPAPPRDGGRGEALVVAYVPDPKAKGLELLCRAWGRVGAADGARLVVTGIRPQRVVEFLGRFGLAPPPGMELAGMLAQEEFGSLMSRARAFVSAARWEDFGQAPLQALERGAALVCAPAGGPFPALSIARALEPGFVAIDREPRSLASALEAALGAGEPELVAYRTAARERLAPYRHEAQVQRMRELVLPALLDR